MVDMKNVRLLPPMGTGEPEVVPTRVTGGSGHQAVSITDFPTDRRWKHPDEQEDSDELSAEYYHEPLILVDGEREPPPLSEDARELVRSLERPDFLAKRCQAEEALAQAAQKADEQKKKKNIQSLFESFWFDQEGAAAAAADTRRTRASYARIIIITGRPPCT